MTTLSIFTHLANPLLSQAQLQENDIQPSVDGSQMQYVAAPNPYYPEVYNARDLASLNGEMPPYQPNYPSSEQGYLVPVWVDDVSEIPQAEAYNWLDPYTDTSVWANYGVAPESIPQLTDPSVVINTGNSEASE